MDSQAATASGNSRLLTMPLEILQHISKYLTTPEYCSLRITCKHIEASILKAFSKEFFSKRQFMLTEFSLQALADISKSRFSLSLTQVIFSIERPSFDHVPHDYKRVDNLSSVPADVQVKRNRLRQEYVDHCALLDTGHFVEMMAEAFSHLHNLETIGIRDFNSRSRYRDAPEHIEWRSYGATTFVRETGVQLQLPMGRSFIFMNSGGTASQYERGIFTGRLFTGLLLALGKSSTRPKRLEIILKGGGLPDNVFNVPKYAEPVILPVLSDLRALYLDLSSDFPSALVNDEDQIGCSSYLTRRFLSQLTKVEHIRLNFQACLAPLPEELISWLSQVPSVSVSSAPNGNLLMTPQPVHFSNLRQLDLGMLKVNPQTIRRVLNKYRATLRGISLHKVCLVQSPKSEGRVNLWQQLFSHMSKIGLNLNHLLVSFLSQESLQKHYKVTFKDHPDTISRTWKGNDWEGALKDFADSFVVSWPETDTGSSDDNDEGNDLEDMDIESDDDSDD